MDLLSPQYNILKIAGSSLGYKHSEEARAKMKKKKHSEETKKKMSEAHKGKPKPEGSGLPPQQIQVLDLDTNETTSYSSIHAAARALNIKQSIISRYFTNNQQKPYKERYIFMKYKSRPLFIRIN
jgi:group I intron endonuclease